MAPEGRIAGSLKQPVGQMKDEKLHTAGAPSTFGSEGVKTARLGTYFEFDTWKKCTALWREAHFKVKSAKTPGPEHLRKLRGRKCTALWREAHS